jgi:hypothetical protein
VTARILIVVLIDHIVFQQEKNMKSITTQYKCLICSSVFKTRASIIRHYMNSHFDFNQEKCVACKDHGEIKKPSRHAIANHVTDLYKCKYCTFKDTDLKRVQEHANYAHILPLNSPYERLESAFNRRVLTFGYEISQADLKTVEEVKLETSNSTLAVLSRQLELKNMLKFSITLKGEYVKYDELGGVESEASIYLRSFSKHLFLNDSKRINRTLKECFSEITIRNEGFLLAGSGWSIRNFSKIFIEIGKIKLVGGCNNTCFNVGKKKKKYLVDVISHNNDCFVNSVAVAFLPKEDLDLNIQKLSCLAQTFAKQYFNTRGLKFPLNIRHIRKFEQKNKALGLQINVYSRIDGQIIPVHKSIAKKPKKIINLFLQKVKKRLHHYIYIKDLDKFFQINNIKNHICDKCLSNFTSISALKNHQEYCSRSDPVKIIYPSEQDSVCFEHHEKQTLQPIYGACDFEASLIPINRQENGVKYNCQNCLEGGDVSLCSHKTINIHEQIPTTYSIALLDKRGKILFEKTESDHFNVMEIFFKTLTEIEKTFIPLLQANRFKKDYTSEEIEAFNKAYLCYLCHTPFQPHFSGRQKVKDHCHYNGEYLGAAHHNCNWKRTVNRNIPIFIHNFQNYDSQFILQGLKFTPNTQISGIPYNMEKFRTLNIGKIVFVDSYHLLPGSISTLVQSLKQNDDHKFPILSQVSLFTQSAMHKKLLLEKGVYPYEWASSISRLINKKKWPKHKHFFSTLKQSNISREEYLHGKQVFRLFRCKNMLEYCHLYCRLDVFLLLEVIDQFRTNVLLEFGLDCTKYISAPQLAFDAMLKGLDEPINLMTDTEMILMCEQNVRGGVAFVAERHVKCKELEKEIKKVIPDETVAEKIERIENKKCSDLLVLLDAVGLYSFCQKLYLPWGDYQWCNAGELFRLKQELGHIPNDSNIGFILEVDLEYPKSLFKKHSSFPMISEKKEITYQDLSDFSKKALHVLSNTVNSAKRYKSEKLVTDFSNKSKYVVHYQNLQTYLKEGIILKEIHKAIKFTQKPYLKPFIDKCAKKRAETKSDFDKMLFKLFMNSVYGKFLQDNRKHMEAKICRKYKTFSKHFNSPLYKGHRIISENVVTVYSKKKTVKLDRLYATGFTILELSKNHMISAWYNYFLPNFETKASVVLTDTDSFLIHIKDSSRKELFLSVQDSLDSSNYPKSHPRYTAKNKGVPGYFKDENCGNYLTEVVGLKAKCYIIKVFDQFNIKRDKKVVCKGIQKMSRDKLSIRKFRNVVKNFSSVHADLYCIRSKSNHLYTQKMRKIALSTGDDKRYILNCGIHTVPLYSNVVKCALCPPST